MAKLIVAGSVEGVEFTKAGSFKNQDGDLITFGDSVKLQLSTVVDIEKQGIKTKAKRSFKVNVPVNGDLEMMVQQYNNMIGKDIQCEFIPTDGQVFQLSGDIKPLTK